MSESNRGAGAATVTPSDLVEQRAVSTRLIRRIAAKTCWLQIGPTILDACDEDAVHVVMATEPLIKAGPGIPDQPTLIVQVQMCTREGIRRVPACMPVGMYVRLRPVAEALRAAADLLGDLSTDMLDSEFAELLDGIDTADRLFSDLGGPSLTGPDDLTF